MKVQLLKKLYILIVVLFACNLSVFSQGNYTDVEIAHSLHKTVTENGNVSDLIDNAIPTLLPFGVSKTIGGEKQTVVLDSASFSPEGGFLTAYAVIGVPKTGDTLAFKVSEAQFTTGGFTGDARLVLLEDIDINIADSTTLSIKSDEQKTYVDWDCNGFNELGIDCEVTFSREFVVPENPDGTPDTTGQHVTTTFETQIQSWDELLVDVSLPPMQFTKLKGFGFYISHAVFDFSETENSSYMVFPPGYTTPSMPEPNSPLWEGFFLEQMQIKLPPEFKNKNSNERITISADNLLIDELGVTGSLSAYNILTLDNGDAGGWAFSLDTLSVSLYTNQLEDVTLAGDIVIPISDEDNELHYSGFIDDSGDYFLNVNLRDTMDVPLWAAKLSIYNNSYVNINRQNHEFVASAVLNGELSITKDGDGSVQIAGLEFQQLTLQNVQPYLDIHTVALSGNDQNKMANFPITIHNVTFTKEDMSAGLGFNLAVNFVGDDDNGFSGDAGFSFWGDFVEVDNRMKWQYREMLFDEISIDVDASAFSLQGSLIIYRNDPTFGKGFKGMINAQFQPGLIVSASAQFGNVNDMRYWYVDGLLVMPTGIPIFPGFGVYGFGGGAYYHMSRQNTENVQIPNDPSGNPVDNSDIPGQSLSGIVYLPDPNIHLGVKASVIVGTFPKPDAFNATVTFEMNFNSGGGLGYIGFQGEAYFMTPIADRGTDSKVYATTDIGYDFNNRVLHGVTSVYVNMPPVIEGANAGNLAGTSVIHFEPGDWYITVGTPDQRVGVKVINLITLTSYFMIGTDIPAMPTPPSNVTEILGQIDFNRDLDELTSGGGFALGASLDISIADTVWIFYGNFAAGAGFDVMLKNYGTDTRCSGNPEPIGIKGWYAQGQVYAYLQGAIGIIVKKGPFKGTYEIIDLGAAAVLQAKLPNPFWMQGNVGGYYSILGGMIEGECDFEFEVGEQCEIEAGSGLEGMSIIAETSPAANSQDVDVFSGAQAAFTMKVDHVFEFVDINNNTRTFKIVLDHFKLMHQGQQIPGNLIWNDNHDVVAIETFDILPGESEIQMKVQVHFEEKINGVWQPVISDGEVVKEISETSFVTGPEPDYIPPHNVLYTYPVENQMNFYQSEVNYGFIQLNQGQPNLFAANDSIIRKARFKSTSHQTDFDYTYDNNTRTVNFNTPVNLQNDKIYAFMLVNIPAFENAQVDENVEDVSENITGDNGQGNVNINTKDIEGDLKLMQEKEIYSSYFKTSKYNTFTEKMNALSISPPFSWVIMNGVHKIGVQMGGNEYFDRFELEGTDEHDALIKILTDNDNTWFNNHSYPLIYCPLPGNSCSTNYPSDVNINWADRPDIVGIAPVRTSFLSLYPVSLPQLTESDIENDFAKIDAYSTYLTNIMDYYHYKDYENLLQQAANHSLNNSNQALINILNSPYPSMLAGYPGYYYYNVELKYYLPGSDTPTSSKTISIGY
jgi:hypothetical protein